MNILWLRGIAGTFAYLFANATEGQFIKLKKFEF